MIHAEFNAVPWSWREPVCDPRALRRVRQIWLSPPAWPRSIVALTRSTATRRWADSFQLAETILKAAGAEVEPID
jgi:hypothetical protein